MMNSKVFLYLSIVFCHIFFISCGIYSFTGSSIPGSKNTEVLVKKSVKNISKLTINEKIEVMEKLKKIPDKKKK